MHGELVWRATKDERRARIDISAAAAVADLAGHSLVPDAECIRKSSRKAVSPVRVMEAPL